MNANTLKATFCALTLTALNALSAPLQRADVPADPFWLAHVDCDGVRPTPVGQFILTEMQKPEAQAKLAAFHSIFSFDLRTQLHGLTLYSTGPRPEDGVLLVYADFDADRLVTLAKAAKDSQNTNHNQHVIYNWSDEKKHGRRGAEPRVFASINGKRVIFGRRESSVAGALDVLDGLSPNLASTQTFLPLGGSGDNSFLEGAARKLDVPTDEPKAAIFRLSKLARLQVGGTAQQVNATLTLDANEEEVAAQMATVAQGLIALGKLQNEKPEAVKLANAISLKQDGANVVARLSLPAEDVLAIMKADAERKAARKARREQAEERGN
jgi:hypothetical protein